MRQEEVKKVWESIQEETKKRVKAEPVLASFFHSMILEHSSFSSAIAKQLANDLSTSSVLPLMIRNIIRESMKEKEEILESQKQNKMPSSGLSSSEEVGITISQSQG